MLILELKEIQQDLQLFKKYLRQTQFSCDIAHHGKSLISVFQEFFVGINKILLLAGILELVYHSMNFRHFYDVL